ncbi:MAG: TetR/AcrR family transcriptional regulator [Proteobacteria bacterium]|nr:TetR/AcrR family transcriptional regulator [Pseudomonadota bacterium]
MSKPRPAQPPLAHPAASPVAAAPSRRRPRPPGRPAAGEGDRRGHVLDAAIACYVQRGIAATSLRDISRQAGVTPALLHYYFGDAAGLRDAVVAERVLPVFGEVRATLLGMQDAPLRGSLEAFVGCICDLVARHPWLPPLWIREVVSEGGGLRELLTTRLMPELASLVAARFAAEQAAGRLNSGLEPRLLLVSLVGLTLLPAAGMPIWRQLFAAEELGVDAIRTHALALLERGLELPA